MAKKIGDVSLVTLGTGDRFVIFDSSANEVGAVDAFALGLPGSETAKTANYTVISTDSRTAFTNTGATGQVIFTLPVASSGFECSFAVTAAQELRVSAPSGNINVGGVLTAGVFLKSSTIGATLNIGVRNGAYVVLMTTGTWADV